MKGNKNAFIILGITFVVLTFILGGYLMYKSAKKVSPQVSQIKPTSSPAEEMATWNDQAEFTFQYPKSLNINPHEEDEENYTHIELTSASHSGNLIIWVKDTTADTIDAWVKQKKLTGGIDSSLDGLKSVKILTSDEPNKLTVSSIRNGYLYQIEVNLQDKEFWQKIYDTVSSSFKYTEGIVQQEKTSSDQTPVNRSSENQSGSTEDDNEEMIE